jgi:V/A-type H+-transporting ATPase subunit K
MKPKARFALIVTLATALLAALGTGLLWLPGAMAAQAAVGPLMDPRIWQAGLVAAALATGLSAVGAAYAVGQLGSAAMGALAEKPELFGRLIIFIGLAEGIAIYGLIVSILILNRLV